MSLADNATDLGVLMYKAGHLEQAKQYFAAQIATDPKNAGAHYMLANVLLELRQTDEAQKQYRLSETLDPYGSTGKYSRLALTRLGNNSFAASSITMPASALSKDNMKDSVRAISSEALAQEQKEQAECDGKVSRIYKEADNKVEHLEDEMKELIAANGQPVYARVPVWNSCLIASSMGRLEKTYDPEPANEAIRQEYNPQIEKIKLQARQEADRIIAAYKEKAIAMEDSAVTLDKSYISKQTGDVSLIPAGTNMYLRNYQTVDNPSGNPVPIMAAPAKLLPGIQPISKATH